MPEVWIPYGEVEASLRLKHENYEGTAEPLKIEGYSGEIKDALYYITDGKKTSVELLQKSFPLLKPFDFKKAGETIIDGVLVKVPENIEKTIIVCTVRLDPLYGFTGPHSILASLLGLEGEVLNRKEKDTATVNGSSASFAARILEETKPYAICHFGGVTQRVLMGPAMEVFKRIQAAFLEMAVKQKKRRLIVASAGGYPYDDTLFDALLSAYNLLPFIDNDGEIILASECQNGLGDEGLRRLTLGLSSNSQASQILGKLKKQAHLTLVSSFPNALTGRLGISGHSSLTEAFEFIESRNSWKLKAWIVKESATLYSGEQ
ncbi:MAG: hypothetical protein JRN26_02140 [Nitrososphaerota archaeon]|jgi:hypothetical protein|nr:hypothetical protein [Nitrososphaerota archaeon]MDG6927264.1 hypothetical protein [Nitrososphaerota archaeon]MDG6930378.1 hypothetical protein [Nitrososphaerota archaeon]MDG6932585.1 hypothetical protein [Nitrososphaerota archaeon]MDG6935677.1 hypothetical protein [Nitrososphaerota archaeon]